MNSVVRKSDDRTVHLPVLLREVIDRQDLRPGLTVVDGTVGGGGHSRAIWELIGPTGRLLGLDRDPAMLVRARQTLTGTPLDDRLVLRQGSYCRMEQILQQLNWPTVDCVLVDLGLSSDQLADPQRGFGFQTQGQLDLRFDTGAGESAAQLLSRMSVEELTQLLQTVGEEPHARAIAERVADEQRRGRPVETVQQLVDVVWQARYPKSAAPPFSAVRSGPHPATQTFQALRIAVNQELEHLKQLLERVLPACLSPGGRAAVITFHSLEDRLVKEAFRKAETWDSLTRKPIAPSPTEVRLNPRCRSAKLRVAVRK